MIKLVVLKTNSNEGELLFQLVVRGRHADRGYYYSCDSWDEERGWVIFSYLCSSNSMPIKVGVAGNFIVTSEGNGEINVKNWLRNWMIDFQEVEPILANTKEEAQTVFEKIRKETMSKADRTRVTAEWTERIRVLRKAENEELLSRC